MFNIWFNIKKAVAVYVGTYDCNSCTKVTTFLVGVFVIGTCIKNNHHLFYEAVVRC